MQAEEVQKELEELKRKNVVAEQMSQSDAVALRQRLESVQKERDELTARIGSVETEKNEALKKAQDLEQRSHELHERLVSATEVITTISDQLHYILLYHGLKCTIVSGQMCITCCK